jgi:ABC-type nitrate/sulfonate/bicarbonate transport system substrate-binding protein
MIRLTRNDHRAAGIPANLCMPPHLYLHTPMNTKLIPPNITQGDWLKAENSPFVYCLVQDGWVKGQPQMVNRFTASIQRGYNSTEEELEANATMMAASKSLAEALAIQLERMEWACENVFSDEATRWLQKSLYDMSEVLKLAGYTLAPVDAE